MFRLFVAFIAFTLLAASGRADDPAPGGAAEKGTLNTEKEKGSYSVGYTIGANLRRQFGASAMDTAAFLKGLQDAITGSRASLSDAEREKALTTFSAQMRRQQATTASIAADKNKKAGDAFLAANKSKPGVKTLPSGLQYIVLKQGNGKQPKATDQVEVHYHGMLINGKVFDSSVDRGQPATFRLDQVIPGWTEVVQLMKEGSKWRVFIPPELAYGKRGAGPGGPIGPNETLIFEIELRKVL